MWGRYDLEDTGLEDWRVTAMSRGPPAAPDVGKGKERMLPQGLCQHLDSDPSEAHLRLSASSTVKEYISVLFGYSVCGDLLQTPQGSGTP